MKSYQAPNMLTNEQRRQYIKDFMVPTGTKNMHKTTHDLLVFKRAVAEVDPFFNVVIVNLIIPTGTVVRFPVNRGAKCRAEKAMVHSIINLNTGVDYDICKSRSHHADESFRYVKGKMVIPDYFDFDDNECSPGIHFFLDLKSALAY